MSEEISKEFSKLHKKKYKVKLNVKSLLYLFRCYHIETLKFETILGNWADKYNFKTNSDCLAEQKHETWYTFHKLHAARFCDYDLN